MPVRKNTLRKQAHHAQRLRQARKGYLEAASRLGVADLFDRLPRFVMERLWAMPILEPAVLPDQASASRPTAPAVRAELLGRLRQATIELDDGSTWPVTDVFTFGLGVVSAFKAILAKSKEPALRQLATRGLAVAQPLFDRYCTESVVSATGELRAGAAEHNRIDTQLVSFTLTRQDLPNGRRRVLVPFTLTDPEPLDLCLDGQMRKAFRCGGHRGPHAPLEWVSWPAATLGPQVPPGDYPVYVQRHALRRVEERLREIGLAAANFWLWECLRQPVLIRAEGEDYLIEYRLLEFRLGYLLARRIGDKVLVTTFKFLTMTGTPEAGLLFEKLRLRRSDIAYQHLDALRTFTHTDLLEDPELLEVFRQCGCGHLAKLRERMDHDGRAYAKELRKYLRMDEQRQRQNLAQRLGLAFDGPCAAAGEGEGGRTAPVSDAATPPV